MINKTITKNLTELNGCVGLGGGGGIFCHSKDLFIINTIFWDDSSFDDNDEIGLFESTPVITYSNIQHFNPDTKITYSIPQLSHLMIKVFDILGKEIETLVKKEKQTGIYVLTWGAENLPSGVYFYKLQAADFIQIKKMVLMK